MIPVPAAAEKNTFFAEHGVKTVTRSGSVMGCPHEEGIDFPDGEDCPQCPFWAGRQGSARLRAPKKSDLQMFDEDEEEVEEEEAYDDDEDDDDDEFGFVTAAQADAAFEWIDNQVLVDPEIDRDQAIAKIAAYLQANLQFPCEVTGSEDFQWEERYVIGGWSPREYAWLKKTQPSYRNRYQLLAVSSGESSDWMMFDEDIAAHVRRISDGKEFVLGLSELKTTQKQSKNHQMIRDYGIWFVNSR